MKIRNGFVSNSSSSSFIVLFDEDPRNNPEYLKRVLYNNMDFIRPEYEHMGDRISTNTLIDEILTQLKTPATMQELIELLRYDMIPFEEKEFLYSLDRNSAEYEKTQEEIDIKEFKLAMKVANDFHKEQLNGKFVFILAFSDNDGDIGAQLEHGDTFRNLHHYVINNH